MPDNRLPWEPHPEGGFIAYPEGRAEPRRFARLNRPTSGPAGVWSWSVRYDDATFADVAFSKQEGSDAANKAWPRVKENARKAAARREWERQQIELIAKAERGEIDPGYFANEAADYENMMWIMDRIKPRPGLKNTVSVGLQRVVDALSAEFARRRTGNKKPGAP